MSCGCETQQLHRWGRDFANLRQQWSDFTLQKAQDTETCCCGPCCRRRRPRTTPKSCSCSCCGPKAKGTFGLAWVAQTPLNKCRDPCGWQVEIIDTPSRIEDKCLEIIEWVNCPPLRELGRGCKKPCCCGRTEQLCDCCLGDCNCMKCQRPPERMPIKIEPRIERMEELCPCKRRFCTERHLGKYCYEDEDFKFDECCKCKLLETNQNNCWPISEKCNCGTSKEGADEDVNRRFKKTDKDTSYHEQDFFKGGHKYKGDTRNKDEVEEKYPISSDGYESDGDTEQEDLTKQRDKKKVDNKVEEKETIESSKQKDEKEVVKKIPRRFQRKRINRDQRRNKEELDDKINEKIIEEVEEEIEKEKKEVEKDDELEDIIKEDDMEQEVDERQGDAKPKKKYDKSISRSKERRRRNREKVGQRKEEEVQDKDDDGNKENSGKKDENKQQERQQSSSQEENKGEGEKPQREEDKRETTKPTKYKKSSSISHTVKETEKPADMRKSKSNNLKQISKQSDDED